MSQHSKWKIIIQAIKTFILGFTALSVVVFLPAWTFSYWQAWIFVPTFVALMTLSGVYFSIKDPALIERRKEAGPAAEQSIGRKINIIFAYLAMFSLLVLSAVDHRFGWSNMPAYISIFGNGLVILANVIWFLSKKENSYAGSAIKIYEGHKVATTGPYRIVRHPNYMGDLILMLGIPLALDSWWGIVIVALMIPSMVWKIHDEEKFLEQGLPGYTEYTKKVRYRLLPYIW